MWSKPNLQELQGQAPDQVGSPPQSPLSPSPMSPTSRLRNPGRRYAQIIKLRPDKVTEYKACHAKVWPEVLKQIKECNIIDYSIFHDPELGVLFASFKYVGYDFTGDMERMRENPKVREWWEMTDSMQESMVPGATKSDVGPDQPGWWKSVEEVFYTP